MEGSQGAKRSLLIGSGRGAINVWNELGVTADVYGGAISGSSCRLPADSRSSKKATMLFWYDNVRFERRSRSDSGYFIMYHIV